MSDEELPEGPISLKEFADVRREGRRNLKNLTEMARQVTQAVETFKLIADSLASRLDALEGRALALECEEHIRGLPENQRVVAKRLLIAEKPTDLNEFISSL